MTKSSTIRNIIIALIMTAVSVWLAATDLVFGWVTAIFFGAMAMILLVKYFKFKKKAITESPSGQNVNNAAEITGDGIFDIQDAGFTVRINTAERAVDWKQVQAMIAYRADRFASDDICLDVFCDNGVSFTITENATYWDKFLDQSKLAFPIVDKFWEIAMVAQPGQFTTTIVYDRLNRNLVEIEKAYYNNLYQ